MEGKVFRTRPDRHWCPPRLLYNGYRVYTGGRAAEAWRWPPKPSNVEVKERVYLFVYSLSGRLWPVLGWTSAWKRKIFREENSVLVRSVYRGTMSQNAPFAILFQNLQPEGSIKRMQVRYSRRTDQDGFCQIIILRRFCLLSITNF
jgi:hypothetical protein